VSAEPSPDGSIEARALWFTAPCTAELRPERVPPPGPGEVRVKTTASAISHGTEMLVYRGEVPADLPLDLPTLAGDFSFPIKDAFVVPAELPVSLPDGLDPTAGLFFANLETALNILHDAPLRLGETALVFGQGVVGLLVTQLLKLAGADRVLVVDPIKKRRELALEVGADGAFEPGENLRERILVTTAGRGADLAVEVSSSGVALQDAIDAVAAEGTVVAASWYGTKPVALSLGGHFHRGRVRLRSSQVGRINPELGPRWDRARRTEAVLGLLPRLRLEELVSHRVPLEKAPWAYRLVDEHPEETVQIVLTHNEG
jgi:threonine dehydrogenase-like Zn-dependent dehydrogenase